LSGSTDNRSLSVNRPRRGRETSDIADGVVRLIDALGRRVGEEDSELGQFARVREALDRAEAEAVNRLRSLGLSDALIGYELGVSKQAVQKRWPRESGA
jgi:hypothetical protein